MLHQIRLVATVCFRCPRPSQFTIFGQNLKKPIKNIDFGPKIKNTTGKSDKEGFQEMPYKKCLKVTAKGSQKEPKSYSVPKWMLLNLSKHMVFTAREPHWDALGEVG